MNPRGEVSELRTQGMGDAAGLWEKLEALPQPIEAVNIYKAAISIKTAEFLARLRGHYLFSTLAINVREFSNTALQIVGENTGDRAEGMRCIEFFETEMPLTEAIFQDPTAYALRQHVFDGIIFLSAAKLGKEKEIKEAIERLQEDVGRAMVTSLLRSIDLDLGGFDWGRQNDKD